MLNFADESEPWLEQIICVDVWLIRLIKVVWWQINQINSFHINQSAYRMRYYSACLPVDAASVRVSNRWHFHGCACCLICRVCVCGEGWLSSSQSGLVFALLIKTGLWVIYLKLSGISAGFLWRAKARREEIKATDCSRLHVILFLLGKQDLLRSWKRKKKVQPGNRDTMYGVTLWNLPLEQIIASCLLFIVY